MYDGTQWTNQWPNQNPQEDAPDQYFPPTNVGSADWNGGSAPAGGTHTEQCVITMQDGTTYTVAHSAAEAKAKVVAAYLPPPPAGAAAWLTAEIPWCGFDVPNSAIPVVLNTANIASIF